MGDFKKDKCFWVEFTVDKVLRKVSRGLVFKEDKLNGIVRLKKCKWNNET